ncbi:hypothetical protein EUTSA_v10006632mg [Eutrema salsugineum]|uniref:RING-type domain-containing protein n=1 Tax=Eutrema salsugineum TaxID=72664 RepID=V4MPY1_EUTSA|nr:NF-X1-type zinc finger protein NFXL1 [Eutrema salsugineum]ESQ33711.1 hypothetical protein EUTSA_v10006632mg [Eutrema salsugineum]
MSSQVRRDRRERSRFTTPNAQKTWVPKETSSTSVVVNETSFPLNTNTNSGSFDAGLHSNYPNQRSSVLGPPPLSRQRRNHAARSVPENHQRGRSRGRLGQTVNKGKMPNKNRNGDIESTVLTDPNLPQLVQEIQDKLMKSSIECMICYDMVRRSANIWSCSSCYSIFHLECIKKWARAPTSIDLLADKNQGSNWRCPGCQSVQLTSSKEIMYRCFCGKRKDPPSDPYLTPHSCGDPCRKPLEKEFATGEMAKGNNCPHVCVLQCHPGPCPPCKAFVPPRSCPCGKKMIWTRCSERKSDLTCEQSCGKLLNCGRHQCERACHIGECDPCQVPVNASCFCKKTIENVLCGDMNVKGEVKAEDGVFSCNLNCEKDLECGNHSCPEVCHPGPCGDCDFRPSRIKTCYCGKTGLQEERWSCLDPIPSCSNICSKRLPCGLHNCSETCHAGDCPPCLVQVRQKCRCGSTSRTVECYKTVSDMEEFICAKPCGRKKNCGRHRCNERCCPLLNHPKNADLSDDSGLHLCQIPCGKRLRCEQHSCETLCHCGHCHPCLEMIFTDLACACGKTSIPPPLPCGTPVPSCQLLCSVPQPCGHSATHDYHFGDCLPCSVPVEKKCIGGHVVLRNIPCGLKDIRCNKICGKTRRCGMHACARTCHPEPCGNGDQESQAGLRVTCGQTCGAPRRDCRHTCAALCNPSRPCPDQRCEFPLKITCSCGRITATVPCDAGGGSAAGFNGDSVYETSILHKLPVPLQPVELNGKRIPLGQRKLTCDEECAKLERKRVLQDAFDITPPNLDPLHFGENSTLTEIISDLYRRYPNWVLAVEERCKFLVLGKARGSTSSALKLHIFCPMEKDKREAVRLIAERWNLAVSNAGWEPKRFIVVYVTQKSKPPTRIIGVKGVVSAGGPHSPAFDPLVDMDPRLVVSFLDLPREANISALVLRFGGECELVWLNDKNALAVFHDPARAATAMRRLDHGSVYQGAVVFVQNPRQSPSLSNAWGIQDGSVKEVQRGNPWNKAVSNKSDANSSTGGSVWKSTKDNKLIAPLGNRWSVLERKKAVSLEPLAQTEGTNSSKAAGKQPEETQVVDDWDKVCD